MLPEPGEVPVLGAAAALGIPFPVEGSLPSSVWPALARVLQVNREGRARALS